MRSPAGRIVVTNKRWKNRLCCDWHPPPTPTHKHTHTHRYMCQGLNFGSRQITVCQGKITVCEGKLQCVEAYSEAKYAVPRQITTCLAQYPTAQQAQIPSCRGVDHGQSAKEQYSALARFIYISDHSALFQNFAIACNYGLS